MDAVHNKTSNFSLMPQNNAVQVKYAFSEDTKHVVVQLRKIQLVKHKNAGKDTENNQPESEFIRTQSCY